MLKNKIMTFFKSPIVKNLFIVLTAVIIVASIISIPASQAGAMKEAVSFRAAPMNIKAGTKEVEMPEVAPGQNNTDKKKSTYSNVFCIQVGNNLDVATYNKEYSLYDGSVSSKYFKNYGSAMWLVDNMYINSASNKEICLDHLAQLVTSPEVEKNVTSYGKITAENIKSLNKTVGGKNDAYGNAMNRNFIEVIEQLVLWNYTNNATAINLDALVDSGFSGGNIGMPEQNTARYLYYGLKYLANKNSGYKSNGATSNVVTLDASNAIVDVKNSKVGPYAIKSNGVTLDASSSLKSKISATVTKADGTTEKLDSSKIVANEDGTFYIDIKDCGQITKSKVDLEAIYTGASTTALVIVNEKDQNLLSVKKNVNTKPLSDEKTVSYFGTYTIRLIKTKQDKTAITNNPAKFTITGAVTLEGQSTDSNGILTIANERTITNVEGTETYTIVEDEAPVGYTKYDGTINVSVGFKTDGTSYILDKNSISIRFNGKNGMITYKAEDNLIDIYIPNIKEDKPEFDLALRKYISKIDGKATEVSREPVIDAESKAVLDKTNTAAYHHTKQSLKVKVGSEIEYTIRVYNEGKVDGVAKVIKDYLPEGLSFVKIADESSKLYTTTSKEGSKEVELVYNGTEVIKANSIERILNKETKNVYQEVKIICKVNQGASGYITNRAEITKYGYTDSENKWHEATAIGNCDRDSVENTIANALGLDTWYVNAKNFSYVENGTTKEVKDYYPGVQDDDDFETVEVEPEVVIDGSFRVAIKKVDASNKNQGLAGAYFTSTAGTAIMKVGPTDENGYVDFIKSQDILFDGQKFEYSIYESEAPEGYSKYEKEIKLNVVTKKDGHNYVVDTVNTKLANEDSNVSLDVKSNVITLTIADEKVKEKDFDLALRKFITNIDGKEITSRIPKVTLTDDFKSGKVTTATYEHSKEPLMVETDNIVIYTIRVYNEGEVDGYASKVMDDIPEGLEFLPTHEINANKWTMYVESDAKVEGSITYNKKNYAPTTDAKKADLIVTEQLKDQLIKAYDAKTMETLDYKDVKVAFKVVEPNSSNRIITNYAQITEHKDKDGKDVTDRDSTPNEWKDKDDDQDIENIKLIEKKFDLALRKFITNINGKEITSRIPKVTLTDDFKSGKVTTAKYEHSKEPLMVETDNIVVYTIRVYNEGEVDGYASKVMDDIPDGLEFLPENSINKDNRWVMYSKVEKVKIQDRYIVYGGEFYVETSDATKADLIVTKKLENELIKAYDAKTMQTLDYKDVKVAFKVVEPNSSSRIITNYAQITEHKDKDGKNVTDRDSTPNEWKDKDDDQDIENIKLIEKEFDLALRKFITNIDGKEITSRIPKVTLTDDFKSGKVTTATYEHSKEPLDVAQGQIIVYTIRVYNEGEVDGYATKVMDDIPEGLEFLPTHEINANKWTMYVESEAKVEGSITYNKKNYVPTTDATKADLIVTEQLKDQLIKAYDAKTMETLDYKDVKVAFKVTESNTSDRIITNYAQVTENKDKNGKDVTDRDSTPNEWKDKDDDQDTEKVKLKYFDLALRKWVTEAIVIENGQTSVFQTGHKAEDDPESIVKVDLKKSKLKDITVKFRYSIRVTNQGEIAGYAKEVTDYIPEGLRFEAADNEGWKLVDQNNAVTDALANTLLNPGESAEVTIVLTWINSQSNMGVKINTAEITKDYNEYGAKDIDSTPGNKVPGEDDIDDAPVMLTVKTGSEVIGYISLAVAFFAIIGAGVYTIKKRVA